MFYWSNQTKLIVYKDIVLNDLDDGDNNDDEQMFINGFVTQIDDMGFEAKLINMANSARVQHCVLSIQGMTCQSCVKAIEGAIGQTPGVYIVSVNLERKEGIIFYDNDEISSANFLIECIEDEGFEAQLASQQFIQYSNFADSKSGDNQRKASQSAGRNERKSLTRQNSRVHRPSLTYFSNLDRRESASNINIGSLKPDPNDLR